MCFRPWLEHPLLSEYFCSIKVFFATVVLANEPFGISIGIDQSDST